MVEHFRLHPRRVVRLRALVAHAKVGWERDAHVLNLGLGGACVSIAETLIEGDRVTVSFLAPTLWDPLQLPARVAWTRPPTPDGRSAAQPGQHQGEAVRVGLAFEPSDPASVFALFELLATMTF